VAVGLAVGAALGIADGDGDGVMPGVGASAWKGQVPNRRAVFHCFPRSASIARMFLPGFVEAYLWTYGNARSRAGARAST